MKNLLVVLFSSLLIFGFFLGDLAAQEETEKVNQTELVGTWTMEVDRSSMGGGRGGRGGRAGGRGGAGSQELVLSIEEGVLVGKMNSGNGSTEAEDLKFDGETLTFTITRENQRGSMEMEYNAELKKGVLVGTMSNERFEMTFKAKKKER